MNPIIFKDPNAEPLWGLLDVSIIRLICELGYGNPTGSAATPARSSFAVRRVLRSINRYLDKPYYVAPSEKVGAEAFAVIRDASRIAAA